MTITFTIGVATLMAAVAAVLQMLQPESWVPFYRAELARKTTRNQTVAGMSIGLVGQAATSAIIALFVTILIMSVVAAADERMHLCAGLAVVALSTVFFVRYWRDRSTRRENAADLVPIYASAASAADDPHGKQDRTVPEVIRSAIFSPRFILAPMFLAASASGQPAVGNAVPVVVAYVLCSVAGLAWTARLIRDGAANGPFRFLVTQANLLTGVAVAALGVITALVG